MVSNYTDEEKSLLEALEEGDKDRLIEVLEENKNLDLDNIGNYPMSSLTMSILFDKEDLIDILVKYGANVNHTDNSRSTPLCYCTYSSINAARVLLRNGADLNQKNHKYEDLPAHSAFHRGDIKMVEYLLRRGTKINIPDRMGVCLRSWGAIDAFAKGIIDERRTGVLTLKDLTINVIYRLRVPHDHVPEILFD